MWIVKTAITADKIKDLLEEGFEPFAVTSVGNEKNIREKMYFRKQTSKPRNEKIKVDVPDMNIKLDYDEKLIKDLFSEILEDFRAIVAPLNRLIEKEEATRIRVFVPDEDSEIDDNLFPNEEGGHIDLNDVDLSKLEESVREDEEEERKMQELESGDRELPAGDGYRVVDEIPEGVKKEPLTPGQESAIEKIRTNHKTNLTISPPGQDGVVTILVDRLVYRAKPDGTTVQEENKANTSGLVT